MKFLAGCKTIEEIDARMATLDPGQLSEQELQELVQELEGLQAEVAKAQKDLVVGHRRQHMKLVK